MEIPYTSLVPNRPGVDSWARDYLTLDGHLNASCTVSDSIHLCGLFYWYAYLIIVMFGCPVTSVHNAACPAVRLSSSKDAPVVELPARPWDGVEMRIYRWILSYVWVYKEGVHLQRSTYLADIIVQSLPVADTLFSTAQDFSFVQFTFTQYFMYAVHVFCMITQLLHHESCPVQQTSTKAGQCFERSHTGPECTLQLWTHYHLHLKQHLVVRQQPTL